MFFTAIRVIETDNQNGLSNIPRKLPEFSIFSLTIINIKEVITGGDMCSLFFSRKSNKKDEILKTAGMENEKKTAEFTSGIKCPRCGYLIGERAIYCENCGFRVRMKTKPNKDREITQELPKINIDHFYK